MTYGFQPKRNLWRSLLLDNGKAKLPGYDLGIILIVLMPNTNPNFRLASRSASADCYPAIIFPFIVILCNISKIMIACEKSSNKVDVKEVKPDNQKSTYARIVALTKPSCKYIFFDTDLSPKNIECWDKPCKGMIAQVSPADNIQFRSMRHMLKSNWNVFDNDLLSVKKKSLAISVAG